jgi:serine/threonine protein kinase
LDVSGREPFSTVPCPYCGTQLVVPKPLAHFLLLSPLGTGGTGTVYRAMDLSLHRFVAVKLLKKELASDASFIADFSREARAAAALNHPNIAQVYSFGVHEGQYYLVMELLGRGSLDGLIDERKRLTEVETLEYGMQIASALRAAYKRGLIHRDVKPGNVLLGEDGRTRLVDFGLAKFRDAEHTENPQDGLWATPYYIAPEKLYGHMEDFRSDMYSLGGTLFHCLAGRAPFEAATATAVVEKNLTQAALSLKTFAPDISDATALLIARLLRKDPAERYPDYDELIHDLELAKRMAVEHAATRGRRVHRKKSPAQIWAQVAGFAVLAIVIIALAVMNWDRIFKRAPQRPSTGPEATSPEGPTVTPRVVDLYANFRKANQTLNLANFTEAAQAYTAAAADFAEQPEDRDWALVMLSLTHLLNGDAKKAARALEPITTTANPQLPPAFSYTSLARTLAWMLTDALPFSALEGREASLPPWGRAALLLARGAREFNAKNYAAASKAFSAYVALPRAEEHRWLFEFQPLAAKLVDETGVVTATVAKIQQLQQEGKPAAALDELNKGKAKLAAATPSLREYLASLEADLKRALERYQREEAARRLEEERRRQEELRAKMEAEIGLIAKAESQARALLAAYDFEELVKTYEPLRAKCSIPDTQNLLASKLFGAAQLVAFKHQLVADISAQPYEKGDLVTARGATLNGTVNKADTQQFTLTKRYGDNEAESDVGWNELPPAQLARLAEYYAGLAAKKTPAAADLAARHLALAVFYKSYGFTKEAEFNARQAVQLKPALKEQATLFFGRIFG